MQHNERPIAENAGFARRDQLVLANLPLAHQIAVRVHENLPASMDIDDLVQAAILGLIDAATKYDPDKKAPFFSYAKHRVRGAILDSLRELDWVPRHLRRLHRQVEAATDALRTTLQRTPVEAEVVEMMGVEEEASASHSPV